MAQFNADQINTMDRHRAEMAMQAARMQQEMSQFMPTQITSPDLMGMTGSNFGSLANLHGANQAARANKRAGLFGAIGNIGGSLVSGLFSDRRLKDIIKPLATLENGLTLYLFKYKSSHTPQIGLIAQEVEKVNPQAVIKDHSGYLKVNYAEAVK